jgi:hypothetical protein
MQAEETDDPEEGAQQKGYRMADAEISVEQQEFQHLEDQQQRIKEGDLPQIPPEVKIGMEQIQQDNTDEFQDYLIDGEDNQKKK